MKQLSISERIDWLQRYIIIHSFIYYETDRTVIDDRTYDIKSKELTKLKEEHPELWKASEYYKQFGDDYNGSTGFTLFHDLDDHQKKIILSIVNVILRGEK